jgi:hypothetical protein
VGDACRHLAHCFELLSHDRSLPSFGPLLPTSNDDDYQTRNQCVNKQQQDGSGNNDPQPPRLKFTTSDTNGNSKRVTLRLVDSRNFFFRQSLKITDALGLRHDGTCRVRGDAAAGQS